MTRVVEGGIVSQSRDRYMIVSADCHAGAAVADYKPYLEQRWHDEFDAWARSFRDEWIDIDPGPDTPVTADSLKAGVAAFGMAANWDNARRIPDLDADFFPSGVVTAGNPRTREEYERRWAGLKAHNRWLVDFCSVLPGRRAGIAQILLNDVDDAVAEIEWVRDAGLFGGVLVPIVEHDTPVPPLFTDAYDRIWAACSDLDVVANQHSSTAGLYEAYARTAGGKAVVVMEAAANAQRGLWHMIFGGVFERFPRLRFVLTELSTGWVVERLAGLDGYAALGGDPGAFMSRWVGDAVDHLSLRPSEYFARNVWIGASMMGRHDVESGVIDVARDKLMWGSDYPHAEGTYPSTADFLAGTFFDRSIDETRAILGETCAELYGFDRAAVRTAADRVGPTVERLGQLAA
jgi:predicted TIM-barrel fold metal-dependent hydrolase